MRKNALFATIICCVAHCFAAERVASFEFSGNKILGDFELKAAISHEQPKWYETLFDIYPVINNTLLEQDAKTIEYLYWDKGFIDAKVFLRTESIDEKRKLAKIVFLIDEGEKYTIDSIAIALPQGFFADSIQPDLGISEGKVFSPFAADGARLALWQYFANRGFLYARAEQNWHRIENRNTVAVNLSIIADKLSHIGGVTFKGMSNVDYRNIQREIRVKSGDAFSYRKLAQTKEQLYATGYFRLVAEELPDTASKPDTVNVNFTLVERKMNWYGFSFNLGEKRVQEVDFPNATEVVAQWGSKNVLKSGLGVKVAASAAAQMEFVDWALKWQFLNHRYESSVTSPWIFRQRIPTTLTLYFEPGVKLQEFPWRAQKFGGDVRLVKQLRKATHSAGANYERADIFGVSPDEADSIQNSQGIYISRKIYYTYLSDTRKNPTNPTQGGFFRFQTDFVGGFLGGDEDYFKLDASLGKFSELSFFRRTVFASRIRLAAMRNTSSGGIPAHKLLLTGGSNSVRGFRDLSIGVVGSGNEAVGGKVMALFSSEIRTHLFWVFYGHIFADAGGIWSEWRDINPDDMRLSTGVGTAVMTPVGPLRFDYARVLSRVDPPPYYRWHVSLMYPY